MDNQLPVANDQAKVDEFKEEIKSGAWKSIASEVWGNESNIRALSQAAREQQKEGGPKVHFEKDDKGTLSIVFHNGNLFSQNTKIELR